MPAAQGKMGRNGQHISGYHTSSNKIDFNLLYALRGTIPKYFRRVRGFGGLVGSPKMAYLGKNGYFQGSALKLLESLKTPRPPYPLKMQCYSTTQTYNSIKLIGLLEVGFLEICCPFRPILPWAAVKTLQLSSSVFSSSFQVLFAQEGYWSSNLDLCSPDQMTS